MYSQTAPILYKPGRSLLVQRLLSRGLSGEVKFTTKSDLLHAMYVQGSTHTRYSGAAAINALSVVFQGNFRSPPFSSSLSFRPLSPPTPTNVVVVTRQQQGRAWLLQRQWKEGEDEGEVARSPHQGRRRRSSFCYMSPSFRLLRTTSENVAF